MTALRLIRTGPGRSPHVETTDERARADARIVVEGWLAAPWESVDLACDDLVARIAARFAARDAEIMRLTTAVCAAALPPETSRDD
ncbi:MAG: hypothetical protein U0807_14195 [Candidatus Binatia bacterium]